MRDHQTVWLSLQTEVNCDIISAYFICLFEEQENMQLYLIPGHLNQECFNGKWWNIPDFFPAQ